ncbi:hypothetical protein SFRURICE_004407 [Spodoptera frugiperda]|nr:hypothetical protein SFRURICE_004407 [Spodoptera frugiperda]
MGAFTNMQFHIHMIMTPRPGITMYLGITHRVASCGNRIHCMLHFSQLPSHRANHGLLLFLYFDLMCLVSLSHVTLTVNTNQTTPIKRKSIESFRLESEKCSVTLTVNTNLTTPHKSKSIKPFRLQSVPNNYTYIHTYILSNNITLLLAQSGKNGVAIVSKSLTFLLTIKAGEVIG